MLATTDDIPPTLFVLDLEWVGPITEPGSAHVTELAVLSVQTGEVFHRTCTSLASQVAINDMHDTLACEPSSAPLCAPDRLYFDLIEWVSREVDGRAGPVTFIAHNGVRYDAVVLLSNMQRYNVSMPLNWIVLDSLHHARYHARHRDAPASYSLPDLCTMLGVTVDSVQRHGALYDTHLLHSMLCTMSNKWSVPYITGYPQPIHQLSTMLIHGVGPSVCIAIGTSSLMYLCQSIIKQHGSLGHQDCLTYLTGLNIKETLPMVNLELISQSIEPAARRYLHYLS